MTSTSDDSRALSAQETNVGAPDGAIRARQGEDDAAAVMTTGGRVGPSVSISITFSDKSALVDRIEIEARTFSYFDREQPYRATNWHYHNPIAVAQSIFTLDEDYFHIAWQRIGEQLLRDIWIARRHPSPKATVLNQGNAESPSSSDLNATGGISRPPE